MDEKEFIDKEYSYRDQIPDEVKSNPNLAIVDLGIDKGFKIISKSRYSDN